VGVEFPNGPAAEPLHHPGLIPLDEVVPVGLIVGDLSGPPCRGSLNREICSSGTEIAPQRAAFHSSSTSFRISFRIILLTSLLAV
jgi:hypothetical protein